MRFMKVTCWVEVLQPYDENVYSIQKISNQKHELKALLFRAEAKIFEFSLERKVQLEERRA